MYTQQKYHILHTGTFRVMLLISEILLIFEYSLTGSICYTRNRNFPTVFVAFTKEKDLSSPSSSLYFFSDTVDISGSEPCADDVIESWSGFSRMLTHHTGPLMSSVTPFVCGTPLYLWQALHFLLQARRVFVAWWFQGFRALCPYSAPPFESTGKTRRGGGVVQTGRRRED